MFLNPIVDQFGRYVDPGMRALTASNRGLFNPPKDAVDAYYGFSKHPRLYDEFGRLVFQPESTLKPCGFQWYLDQALTTERVDG